MAELALWQTGAPALEPGQDVCLSVAWFQLMRALRLLWQMQFFHVRIHPTKLYTFLIQ